MAVDKPHRLSPTGPVLEPGDYGPGASLGSSEITTNITNTNDLVLDTERELSNDGVANLQAGFTTPPQDSRFRAEAAVDVHNRGSQSATVEIIIESNRDQNSAAPGTWVEQVAVEHTVVPTNVVRCTAAMINRQIQPAVPGTDDVQFRARAKMTADGADNGALVTLDAPPTSGTQEGNSRLYAERIS